MRFDVARLRLFIVSSGCPAPFGKVEGVGCLHVIGSAGSSSFTFDSAITGCLGVGGDLFEFKNFPIHYQLVEDFVFGRGGNKNNYSWSIYIGIGILYAVTSEGGSANDVWIGLKYLGGKFKWRRSGIEFPTSSDAWQSSSSSDTCVFMDFYYTKKIKGSFMASSCSSTLGYALCQKIY